MQRKAAVVLTERSEVDCRGLHPPIWCHRAQFYLCANCGVPLCLTRRVK
jgi:hypothetical protein